MVNCKASWDKHVAPGIIKVFLCVAQLVESPPWKRDVAGSSTAAQTSFSPVDGMAYVLVLETRFSKFESWTGHQVFCAFGGMAYTAGLKLAASAYWFESSNAHQRFIARSPRGLGHLVLIQTFVGSNPTRAAS